MTKGKKKENGIETETDEDIISGSSNGNQSNVNAQNDPECDNNQWTVDKYGPFNKQVWKAQKIRAKRNSKTVIFGALLFAGGLGAYLGPMGGYNTLKDSAISGYKQTIKPVIEKITGVEEKYGNLQNFEKKTREVEAAEPDLKNLKTIKNKYGSIDKLIQEYNFLKKHGTQFEKSPFALYDEKTKYFVVYKLGKDFSFRTAAEETSAPVNLEESPHNLIFYGARLNFGEMLPYILGAKWTASDRERFRKGKLDVKFDKGAFWKLPDGGAPSVLMLDKNEIRKLEDYFVR